MDKNEIMDLCVKSCMEGMKNHEGGPFGSAIVKAGQVIAVAHNTVIGDNDPTAHGEVNAIREACKKLNTFDLSGCELYTTSEPCPMCMSAIIWANISKVYYGCTVEDARDIGFRDEHILKFLKEGCKDKNILDLGAVDKKSSLKAFEYWSKDRDKTEY
ncbi:TPA: nucleoside deaminase [Clostridium botulinum]|uniref:nucleoside deaminase n=1 Tax=Clostridium botulinum TaxID=1491 RepID=UPI000D0D7AC5|nr:nucleoside deaminase [Clostridium botulinum]EKS4344445.1 nucleoside deaminase [Clostridium botulinum]EKS4394323.1 nucleoside deaminase [Clostridium botulinum]PSM02881.1 nucleoside deaminase [Clostridium botulinum]HDK7137337.1 nucleoside deaminase [Clostridium botulinum]HDK7140971.1 nucleoside deaminase [Clostridium botulinum]